MATTSFLHPRGCVRGSTMYRNDFPRDIRGIATYEEASPIPIAAKEKRLQFRQWHRHRHILGNTSVLIWTTSNDRDFHFVCWAKVNIPMERSLEFRFWQGHTFAYVRTYLPRYNGLWALVLKRERMIFRYVCRAAVDITKGKSLQFRHFQHNPWLGPRGCVRETTMLQLVGAVSLIHFFHTMRTMTPAITIQQDGMSPSEGWLTWSQDSWSRQHNRLQSLRSMSQRMVVWEEIRAWHGLASVFCLLFVFRLFFNGLVFDGRANALEEC